MKVYGNLQRASLETLGSDPTAGIVGRIWWNTATAKPMLDDGTNNRALLRNDGKIIVGSSGTAASNVRLHRGAAGLLQFVLGSDTTAEGSISTAINQISFRAENYATAGLPTAASAGRLVWNTDLSTFQADNGSSFKELVIKDLAQTLTNKTFDTATNTFKSGAASAGQVLTADGAGNTSFTTSSSNLDSPGNIFNIGISTSVAANALTINLLTKALATPAGGDPVKISFRNATSATGDYVLRSITSALSIVVPSSATLGHTSAVDQYIYLCAIDNAGTVELAVIGSRYDIDEGSVISSTTISGSATDWNTFYSTTGRSNKAMRILARIKVNEATAGTWASNSTEISIATSGVGTWPFSSSRKSNLTFTFGNLGTVTNQNFWSWRHNEFLFISGSFTVGTPAGGAAFIQLPSGISIDSAKFASTTNLQSLGYGNNMLGGPAGSFTNGFAINWMFDGGLIDYIFPTYQTTTQAFDKEPGSAYTAGDGITLTNVMIPVKQWRSY